MPFDIEIAVKTFEAASDLPSAGLREKILEDDLSRKYHSGQISSSDFFEIQKTSLELRMNFEDFGNAWNSIVCWFCLTRTKFTFPILRINFHFCDTLIILFCLTKLGF